MRKFGWLQGLGVLALVLTISGVSWGQYIPIKIVGEGQPSPTTGDNIVTLLGQHNVTSMGEVAVELDDAGPTPSDDYFWVNGLDLYRAGTTVTGGLSPTDFVDNFDTYTQLNDDLDLVWVGDDLNGDFLALNGTGLIFDNDVATGIPGGRLHTNYNEACIDASGNIYFRADLDGTTNDDEVIYYIPFGGAAVPLDLGVGTGIFQEGQLIIGGPLDGQFWDDAATFVGLECSNSGVLLMEADVETSTEVLVRKQPGMVYELLLSEGDMFLDLVSGIMAPVENINQISQARGNLNWAIDAKFDDAVLSTTTDDVVFADVGAGITLIAQEGQDISAITGIPGTTFGFLSQVSVNTNGIVVYLADIQDDGVNIPPYQEAIFQWDAGVTTLIISDEVPIPGSSNLLTNLELDLYINDQDRIFFQGDDGTADAVFEAFLPLVFPVDQLTCAPGGTPDQIIASWSNPQTYDGIRIYENGVLAATLAGTAVDYTTGVVTSPTLFTIEVEPFIGADNAPLIGCSATAVVAPDFTECQSPGSPIDSALPPQTDVLTVATNVLIDDLTILLQITHTFQADLDIDVTSPSGTTVVLTTDNGGGNDNVDTTFADFGNPISSNLNDFDYTQPEGPGTMADFKCELSGGDWTLGYDDDAGGDTGTLDTWCVNIYESTNNLDCCPKPALFSCANVGACGGPAAELTWVNNSPYDLLQLIIDDGVTQTTIALATTDTSYTDLAVVDGTTYNYTLQYTCPGGSLLQDAASCDVAIDTVTVPPVTDLLCSVDFCSNEASLSWNTNGVGYSSVSLERAGVFLADVTGLSSFVDTSPLAGTATYSVVANCGGSIAAANCGVDNVLAAPSGFTCVADSVTCDGSIAISWTNEASYDALDLLIDGVAPSPQPVPGDTAYVTAPLAAGLHTIELTASCGGNGVSVLCDVTVYVPPAGETDCILALEGLQSPDFGDVNSVSALQNALQAGGFSVYVTAPDGGTIDTSLPCGVILPDFDRVWVMTGTFPDDYRITAAEGDFLAAANQAGAGMYFEAGDHWGFVHVVSGIDARDGVEEDIGANIVDGGDTYLLMDAQDSTIGLDLTTTFPAPVIYGQDQTGTDFTDELAVTGTTMGAIPDAEVSMAGPLFRQSVVGDEFISAIYAQNLAGGSFISSSFEFGGFGLDPLDPAASDPLRASLAAAYAGALGPIAPPMDQFIRGDCNSDLGFNIADAIYTLAALFSGGPPGACLEACDSNADASINIADAVYTLAALFSGGPAPAAPHPDCGDGTGAVSCDTPPACP